MLAFCGLRCDICPIFLATLEKNKSIQLEIRKSIAKECREHYHMEILVEEITDCEGCKTESDRLFSGCQKCEIRKCAQNLKLKSCAYCKDYSCSKLNELFVLDPSAKARLDKLRHPN